MVRLLDALEFSIVQSERTGQSQLKKLPAVLTAGFFVFLVTAEWSGAFPVSSWEHFPYNYFRYAHTAHESSHLIVPAVAAHGVVPAFGRTARGPATGV